MRSRTRVGVGGFVLLRRVAGVGYEDFAISSDASMRDSNIVMMEEEEIEVVWVAEDDHDGDAMERRLSRRVAGTEEKVDGGAVEVGVVRGGCSESERGGNIRVRVSECVKKRR